MDASMIISGALLAAGGGILYSLKSIPIIIWKKVKQRIIYTVRIYQYDELFMIIEKWLYSHYKKQYRDVEAYVDEDRDNPYIMSNKEIMEREERIRVIKYKQEENAFIIKWKGKRIVISKGKEKIEKAQSSRDIWFRKYVITGVRAAKQIEDLINAAIQYARKQRIVNTIKVYSNDSYGNWQQGTLLKVKPLEKTILNATKKSVIIGDIDKFVDSEEWYSNVCIPYKRGYCFYGPPGTGKTTLALALANHLHRDIYCLNLNCMEDDGRLPNTFGNIPANSVLLIEDIDKVFSGRENVKEGSKITFSSVLNCLDGAFYKHGLVTIITTNHLDKLDEALLRTGRIDVKMEIPRPSDTEISEYVTVFFGEEFSVKGHFDIKMSDVQEICLRNSLCPELAKQEIISLIKN